MKLCIAVRVRFGKSPVLSPQLVPRSCRSAITASATTCRSTPGEQWERYRVREIQLARDGDEWTIHTVINDRLQELLLKLAKRTIGIVNGSKGSGGDGTRPTPPEKPGIEPAAPEGLVVDQQVYLDRQGVARGQITAGWGAVTESTKGQAVEIGGYELWWRANETKAVWTRVARRSMARRMSLIRPSSCLMRTAMRRIPVACACDRGSLGTVPAPGRTR